MLGRPLRQLKGRLSWKPLVFIRVRVPQMECLCIEVHEAASTMKAQEKTQYMSPVGLIHALNFSKINFIFFVNFVIIFKLFYFFYFLKLNLKSTPLFSFV